ncbi:ATP-binding protein [Egicoccus sp. AB-alg6-2]|uniref:ATP-binding protein n=1 Tax=Egicoccus sp. AB-alg6-2 TaxID=3242692 RepID=UPI00359D433B
MYPPTIPDDEPARVAALEQLALLDTAPEERFDRITRAAAALVGMPIVLINLVDERRQWAKSAIGMPHGATADRPVSFCAHVVGDAAPVLVAELARDRRFHDNPMVTGDPFLRAYFGVPVRGPSGHVLGSLCVADTQPRALDETRLARLGDLAGWVEAELDRSRLAALAVQERATSQRLEALTSAVGDSHVVVGRDIAERRRHETALRNLRHLYESILDAAGDAILGLDVDGRVEYANAAANTLFAVPEGDLLGVHLHERFHDRYEDGSPYAWDDCPSRITLREGRPRDTIEEVYFRADGTPFAAEYVSTPLFADGEVSGAVLMIRDVEARRAVERMKDEFVATVSHELRTPLTSIKGTLSLVLGGVIGEVPAEVGALLAVTHDNTERLIRLVDDILDLERLVAGRVELCGVDTDARHLVDVAVDAVGGLAAAAGVTVEVEVEPVALWADADRIVQALTNLIGNAIKFSSPGMPVRITSSRTPEGLVLTVTDQGRGIAVEAQSRIFERFGQADASDRREQTGTGLGLPIARGLVEQHGGRLQVESDLGRGSRFHLTLPLPAAIEVGP